MATSIAVGKMVQSFSGAANGMVNLAFRYFQDDYTALVAACDAFSDGTASVTITEDGVSTTYYCGTEIAKAIKKFLNYEVAESQKGEYEQPKTEARRR